MSETEPTYRSETKKLGNAMDTAHRQMKAAGLTPQPGFDIDAFDGKNSTKADIDVHHIIPTAQANDFDELFDQIATNVNEKDRHLYTYDHNGANNGAYLPGTNAGIEAGEARKTPVYAVKHGAAPAYAALVKERLLKIQDQLTDDIKKLEFDGTDTLENRDRVAREAFHRVTNLQNELRDGLVTTDRSKRRFFMVNGDKNYQAIYGLDGTNPGPRVKPGTESKNVGDTMEDLFYKRYNNEFASKMEAHGQRALSLRVDGKGQYRRTALLEFNITNKVARVTRTLGGPSAKLGSIVTAVAVPLTGISLIAILGTLMPKNASAADLYDLVINSDFGITEDQIESFATDAALEVAIGLAVRLAAGPLGLFATAYDLYDNYDALSASLQLAQIAFPDNEAIATVNEALANVAGLAGGLKDSTKDLLDPVNQAISNEIAPALADVAFAILGDDVPIGLTGTTILPRVGFRIDLSLSPEGIAAQAADRPAYIQTVNPQLPEAAR